MRFLARLLLRGIATMLVTTFLLFVGVEASIPGGYQAVVLPNGIDPNSQRSNAIVEAFHLDEPVLVRYGYWLMDAVQGDFGRSNRGGTEVFEVIMHRLPISLELALASIVLAAAVGVPLGVLAASNQNQRRSRSLSILLSSAQALPVFITSTLFIWLFAVTLGWVRSSGWTRLSDSLTGNLGGLILPAASLAIAEAGFIARTVRSDVGNVLGEDFVISAMGKGMSSRYVLFRHALRPASLGLLNVIGFNVGAMLSGSFVAEIVFGIGGLGQVLLDAIFSRDLYLLLGLTVYAVGVFVLVNTVVDLITFWADPRIRRETGQ